MKYFYYPGCSLKGTGRAYEESLLAVFEALGVPLTELPQWNCCGATAYMSVDQMQAFTLAARNLALAAELQKGEPACLVAPCNACYLCLAKVQQYARQYPKVRRTIADALAEGGMRYDDRVRVRHPLDVLINDIGTEAVARRVTRPLKDVKIACYYGCQVVRPYAGFDDQNDPMTMDKLLRAAGAETVDWPLKTRCCGASLTGTIETAGLRLSQILLREAHKRGAEFVATCCPLCQFNLECYQPRIRRRFGDGRPMPVAYFTQMLGLAFGLDRSQLGLQRMMTPVQPDLTTV